MKLGTYANLSSRLLGLALVWSSFACGNRSPLLQEEDAGVVTEDEGAQRSSSGGSGGRTSTNTTTPRAGRGAAGAAGMAGAVQATAGRAARAGRGGSSERAGAGGRDSAAGSGDDKKDEEKAGAGGEQAGSGGEGGAGGENAEQAGSAGEAAGAGGEMSGVAGMDAAGSGGVGGEQTAGTGAAPAPAPGSLSQLTPAQVSELCGNIDMATAGLPWGDGIRGYCSRRGLAEPAMCSTIRDMCVDGPEITPVCAQTIPDCPMITITEYQRCRIDTLYRFVEDNRMITCDTMPPLPEPSTIQSCDVIYDRCPAARDLRVL